MGQVTSRERGELVTQVAIICANGNALPPVFVFPRVRFDEKRMMSGATPGALGLVHKSGWMTSENFIKVLRFFKDNVRCGSDHPVLLIMDNHDSHISVEGINFCRENGITILTLPPHTSNRLQPLDRCVFGPFKKYFSEAVHSWMINHPNETISIYSLPELCSKAWDRAATPENVKSGFLKCGISPVDRNIFQDHDFLCSSVSDRPIPVSAPLIQAEGISDETETAPVPSTQKIPVETFYSTPSTSTAEFSSSTPHSPQPGFFISPEQICPFPKAKPRKETKKGGRKRGKSMIATDTPEKEDLEENERKRNEKKVKASKKKVFEESSDEEVEVITKDSSSEWEETEDDDVRTSLEDASEGDFLVVKVPSKKGKFSMNYVARVENKLRDGFEVAFFKRLIPSNRFQWTSEELSFINVQQVVLILPRAIEDTRPRFKNMFYFNTDLSALSLQ